MDVRRPGSPIAGLKPGTGGTKNTCLRRSEGLEARLRGSELFSQLNPSFRCSMCRGARCAAQTSDRLLPERLRKSRGGEDRPFPATRGRDERRPSLKGGRLICPTSDEEGSDSSSVPCGLLLAGRYATFPSWVVSKEALRLRTEWRLRTLGRLMPSALLWLLMRSVLVRWE